MPKPVNGCASWPQSLKEKYERRVELLDELQNIQAEIAILELHMLMQEMRLSVGTLDDSFIRSTTIINNLDRELDQATNPRGVMS